MLVVVQLLVVLMVLVVSVLVIMPLVALVVSVVLVAVGFGVGGGRYGPSIYSHIPTLYAAPPIRPAHDMTLPPLRAPLLAALRAASKPARYKTIFIGSRLDSRLLGERYDDYDHPDDQDPDQDGLYSDDSEGGFGVEQMEEGGRGSGGGGAGSGEHAGGYLERGKGSSGGGQGANTLPRLSKVKQGRSSQRRSRERQESTRELVDFFAERMQEARDAWSSRVQALQKRWQASFIRGEWGMRGGGSASVDRDAALRLTFGLIVRMYAYEDALDDLRLAAEQDPSCLEAFAPQVEWGKK